MVGDIYQFLTVKNLSSILPIELKKEILTYFIKLRIKFTIQRNYPY